MGSAMEGRGDGNGKARQAVWLPEMDRLLLVGMKHGRSGISAASKGLRRLAPKLKPGEIWRRMRHLRETRGDGHLDLKQWPPEILQLLEVGYRSGGAKMRAALRACREHYPGVPSHVISRFARQQGWLNETPKKATRGTRQSWSEREEELLWRLAGYDSVQHIAQKLRRSENAVRVRLKAQGLSGRVKDGVSLRNFQQIFHIGHRKAYALIGNGTLRVRDPRISAKSLAGFCVKQGALLEPAVVDRVKTMLHKPTVGYSWERAASLLGMSLGQVQARVATEHLRVVDTFITEKAFEDFCRICGTNGGPKVNCQLMKPQMLEWLVKGYGFAIPQTDIRQPLSPSEKQALVARVCGKCRKEIRGNVYFAHIRACKGSAGGGQILLHGS